MAISTGMLGGSGGLNGYEYDAYLRQREFYETQRRAMNSLSGFQPAGIAPPPVNKEVSNTDLILLIEETQDEA